MLIIMILQRYTHTCNLQRIKIKRTVSVMSEYILCTYVCSNVCSVELEVCR